MFGLGRNKVSEEKISKAVDDFKRGSAEAFHLLYNAYNKKIYRFCLRMLGDEALAEDAFQETFIKIYEKNDQFRGDNFQAWLFTIARNTCLNTIRSQKDFDSFDETFHKPEKSKFGDVGMKDYISRAIAKLPVDLREALVLREYSEHSYKEIADILDIELSLAKVRVHRARQMLKKLLKPLVKELNEY